MNKEISFTLNGEEVTLFVDVRKSLLEMLREDFSLIGTKEGCGVGECGACTVVVDNVTLDSCLAMAVWADGKNIKTIEGEAQIDGTLSDVQEDFVEAGAVQCGFCIPGMVMSASNYLGEVDEPTRQEIKRALSGNMCRCTGYSKIVDAVENTAAKRAAAKLAN
ncbi:MULTISPECIES: xanthine dehydrogenase subunit XdhC [Enterococcus]|uniref:(2Fe-2S)-binding protein n=1 Tax=Enterococcus alishanensis TaxID=1303817 RepID=A0ABS6TDY4_9ENTE|nr:xanthine dehydrogenase subunit XdhC [Enterococcus alishanensis]MBV7391142.1 (2Fe-2S)-binding protein [Enterococcus alishanensis]